MSWLVSNCPPLACSTRIIVSKCRRPWAPHNCQWHATVVRNAAELSASSSTSHADRSRIEYLLMTGAKLTTAAQDVWGQFLRPGDTAVDATCGNGHDTSFLCNLVGKEGAVYAFDIQEKAVLETRARLQRDLAAADMPKVSVLRQCHSTMQQVVGSNTVQLVVFNLGYLPSSDKSVVTSASSTVAAIEAALEVIRPGGLVSIMSYTGHGGGREEYEALRELLSGLTPNYWITSELKLINRPSSPSLLLVWRRSDIPGLS